MTAFDRVEVFSATKARDRAELGAKMTEFLQSYEGTVTDKVVVQSSDNEFHCLTIVVFCKDLKRRRENGRVRHQDGE